MRFASINIIFFLMLGYLRQNHFWRKSALILINGDQRGSQQQQSRHDTTTDPQNTAFVSKTHILQCFSLEE